MNRLRSRSARSEGGSLTVVPTNRELDPVGFVTRRRRISMLLAFVPVVVAVLSWELVARENLIDTRIFPAPSVTMEAAWHLTTSGELLHHLAATMRRLCLGYGIGFILGLGLGVVLGRLPLLKAAASPTLSALYAIPKLGVFPLLMLMFGIGEGPKVIITAYATFLVISIAMADAFSSVPSNYLDVAKNARASRFRLLTEVMLPAVLAQIFTAARLALGIALLVIIAVEFIASNEGVGFLIWNSWGIFQPAKMYVGIVLSALMGAVLTGGLNALERWCTPWRFDRRPRKSKPVKNQRPGTEVAR